jgi:hypothetical protein
VGNRTAGSRPDCPRRPHLLVRSGESLSKLDQRERTDPDQHRVLKLPYQKPH